MPVKRVIILQGTSGSGKSTWARRQKDAVICSADDNLIDPDGSYRFTPERQAEGHKLCLRKFTTLLMASAQAVADRQNYLWSVRLPLDTPDWKEKAEILIVDNTNTRSLYMAPYVALAQAFQCQVEILSFRAPVEVCVARNNGRAPLNVVKEMVEAIDHFTMPPLWVQQDVDFRVIHTNG